VKVNICGAGHQVEIEVDHTDLSYVIEKAKRLFEETRPERERPGVASAGFQTELRYPRDLEGNRVDG